MDHPGPGSDAFSRCPQRAGTWHTASRDRDRQARRAPGAPGNRILNRSHPANRTQPAPTTALAGAVTVPWDTSTRKPAAFAGEHARLAAPWPRPRDIAAVKGRQARHPGAATVPHCHSRLNHKLPADLGRLRICLTEWLTQCRKASSGGRGRGGRYSSWHFVLSLPNEKFRCLWVSALGRGCRTPMMDWAIPMPEDGSRSLALSARPDGRCHGTLHGIHGVVNRMQGPACPLDRLRCHRPLHGATRMHGTTDTARNKQS